MKSFSLRLDVVEMLDVPMHGTDTELRETPCWRVGGPAVRNTRSPLLIERPGPWGLGGGPQSADHGCNTRSGICLRAQYDTSLWWGSVSFFVIPTGKDAYN